ncbi:hypothetical protein ES288_D13G180000v1 [Gossypium darwinii]|uniref:Uncharacterized protein n=1 Tax=Gossypium darwinii TaxID=34276 RepID=A0A5D1ZZ91_GOSDA|nr:hypothetical protein ES288_D13G180000v1 [Gossypium darwinii]
MAILIFGGDLAPKSAVKSCMIGTYSVIDIRFDKIAYCSAAHNRASTIPNDKTGIGVVEGCLKRSIECHCFHLDNRAYILDWLSFSFHYALVSGLPECPSHDCSNLTKIMPLFRKTTLSQVRKSIFSFKVDQSTSIDRQTFFAGPHIRRRLAAVGMYSCVNHQMAILIFGGRFSTQICL